MGLSSELFARSIYSMYWYEWREVSHLQSYDQKPLTTHFVSLSKYTVDKSDYMVGSYGPRPEQEYEFLTSLEESPKGMLARGTYNIKSKFTDDDKHDHLSWEWSLNIKKDWKDWFLLVILPSSPSAWSLCLFLAGSMSGLCCFKLLLSPSIDTVLFSFSL